VDNGAELGRNNNCVSLYFLFWEKINKKGY